MGGEIAENGKMGGWNIFPFGTTVRGSVLDGWWLVDYSAVGLPGREIPVDEEEESYLHLGAGWGIDRSDGGDVMVLMTKCKYTFPQ